MNWQTTKIAFGVLTGLVCAVPAYPASAAGSLSGQIIGHVRGATGVAQMGATVILYNRYDRVLQQGLTNERGAFQFASLAPDLYSIRVTLSSFVPAFRRNISVEPGVTSLLTINMASVLSSVELVYSPGTPGALMTDDWKWVLRSSQATRPVLRFRPNQVDISDGTRTSSSRAEAVFSDTRGLVKVSAGDPGALDSSANQPDLGTSFALATSVYGRNHVAVSGNVGYTSRSGLPAAGFRTAFSREVMGTDSPEVTLTMRQVYLPTSRGGLSYGQDAGPALRTMSITTRDQLQLTDDLRLEYGFAFESVSFLERLNYASPFARATYKAGNAGSLQLAYSSGAPPAELFTGTGEKEADLHQDLAVLSLLPRVTLRDGNARVQRSQNMEIGFQRVVGPRTFSVGAYRESISNSALMMAAPFGFYASSDVLPDFSSQSSVFNIGHFSRMGYIASVSQSIGDRLDVALSYGRAGVLTRAQRDLESRDPDELRSLLRSNNRSWVAARVSGTVPVVGTRLASGYGWTDPHALMPMHLYLTQKSTPDMGWNVSVRQPLPAIPGLFGRFEAVAELRNLLAQGYLPFTTADNRRILLIQAPRAVRGGVSFIF